MKEHESRLSEIGDLIYWYGKVDKYWLVTFTTEKKPIGLQPMG